MNIIQAHSTHSGKLERWLGRENVEQISFLMQNWYGPPIALGGVPGKVFAHKGGDFRGRITTGAEATVLCALESFGRSIRRGCRHARPYAQVNTGFASLSDLIAEATGGKKQDLAFMKLGPTKVIGATSQLWQVDRWPPIGSPGAAPPGGTAHTKANTGAMAFNNPSSPDTTHFVSGFVVGSLINTLLLYDRLFSVAKTINSTGTEAVTGVPTRYQNTTPGQKDSIAGNFLFMPVGLTAYANTAHNWTVCTYKDQADAASTMPSLTGNPGGVATIIHRFDMPLSVWFAPLETGDTGIKALTQMQCSALVATGLLDFVIGHPIAWLPIPIANVMCVADGINTAFNLTQIFDDACLSFLEVAPPVATATNYSGTISIVSG